LKSFDCPHCGKPGISVVRKLCLGPALPANCTSCGKKVGVPNKSMLVLVPLGVAIPVCGLIRPFSLGTSIAAVIGVALCVAYVRLVPLEPR
jgi:predicted RNA-binding Zn-ribbon protein involved in translation (DUF1610 family)